MRSSLSGIFCVLFGWAFAAFALGCGSAPPPPADAPKTEPVSSAESNGGASTANTNTAAKTLPADCTPDEHKLCLPPAEWAESLCGGSFPEVALAMFGKGTPWTRGYLRRSVEAWNASGRASSNEKVEFDEEVILLVHKAAATGGMVVSGATGSFQALRWNGTCVSLMGDEVTQRLPPKAKFAKIPWKTLDFKTREALMAQEKIGPLVEEQRKECKGASMSEPSAACKKIDAKLSATIVEFIRSGGALPAPENIP